MKRTPLIIAMALLLSVPVSTELWAQAAETAPGSAASASPISDQDFFTKASGDGAAEVRLGQLAIQKAASPSTRSFAQQLVKDHTAANQQLAALAHRKHATIATQAPPSSLQDKLQSLSGPEFDKAYVMAMVGAHQKAIELFDAASHSSDPDVKAFATATLPTLRQHLQMAQSLSGTPTTGMP